jgi:hypothetical protein
LQKVLELFHPPDDAGFFRGLLRSVLSKLINANCGGGTRESGIFPRHLRADSKPVGEVATDF